jgi:hypothetical protein
MWTNSIYAFAHIMVFFRNMFIYVSDWVIRAQIKFSSPDTVVYRALNTENFDTICKKYLVKDAKGLSYLPKSIVKRYMSHGDIIYKLYRTDQSWDVEIVKLDIVNNKYENGDPISERVFLHNLPKFAPCDIFCDSDSN